MKSKSVLTAVVALTLMVAGGTSAGVFATEKGFKAEEYFQSPWLGIEIVQGGEKVVMLSSGPYADALIKVGMGPKPFMLRFPKRTEEDVVQICMWADDSVFWDARVGLAAEEISFFAPGTGIAGADHPIPILYLDKEAHNYFIDERLVNYSASQHGIPVSEFAKDGIEYPVLEQQGSLYMVVFMDLDKDGVLDDHEVEYFVLDF